MKLKVISSYHDLSFSGHQGKSRADDLVRSLFFWENMYTDIRNDCQSCKSCTIRKRGPNNKTTPSQWFPEIIYLASIDGVVSLTITDQGNKYILTFQDTFSKYPEAICLPNQKAETIARVFYLTRHGDIEQLLSDRGSNFTSKLMKEICALLRINKIQTTVYHPACIRKQERGHQTFIIMISHFVDTDQKTWDEWVP
ncbi:hypothetical protein PR048_023398 [Dryococelus australis]|uniref:RNA-directed DNA polymerase n=1 Tax=Dryococelus australis TaxID=614101 RepID=A0ABQ9GTZ1_9NEOP|nr:hypothetical protein PR048_023398 [Dryococelus australis]